MLYERMESRNRKFATDCSQAKIRLFSKLFAVAIFKFRILEDKESFSETVLPQEKEDVHEA